MAALPEIGYIDEKNKRKVVGYKTLKYDPKTGTNPAWDLLTTQQKKEETAKYNNQTFQKTSPFEGDGMSSGDNILNASSDIQRGITKNDVIKNYTTQIPVWENVPPDVKAPTQNTNIEPGKPLPSDKIEPGGTGADLGNPPNAPADMGLHAVNDWLIPGDISTEMLQAFDLFGVGEGGYTQAQVNDYNKQAQEYNDWIDANPDLAKRDNLQKYDLWTFTPVTAPTDTPWEKMQKEKIDAAKADGQVTSQEVNNIFANSIYTNPTTDANDLTAFIDEQNQREQRKKAREKQGYLSMNQTFGMDLGTADLNIPGLF